MRVLIFTRKVKSYKDSQKQQKQKRLNSITNNTDFMLHNDLWYG